MMENNSSGSRGSSGDMAVIGEGTPNRTSVSIQVLQNIYHELTGKSEEVSKSYSDAFHILAEDFRQLDYRVSQACEQYNICANNCSVNVFYINDTKEKFSSFSRFGAFNAGNSSAIESILITYDFLLILPKLEQPQSYTVSVRVASPVSIQRKMNENLFEVPKVFRLMGGAKTAVVSVKYVDYAVARTMLNTIDEWFKALPKSDSGWLWRIVRGNTNWIPFITRYITGVGAVWLAIFLASLYLNSLSSPLELARFLLLSGACIFAAYKISWHLGRAAEDSIDRWVDLAYISITAGDAREVELAKKRNKWALIGGLLRLIGGLLVSVVAKAFASFVTGFG